MIRLATPDDAAAIQAIYAPVVEQTAISFEWQPPSIAEMRRRIEHTLMEFPWLVGCAEARILGYAYAASFRSRPAYRWNTEVSVYVSPEARRQGVASRLYRALFSVLELQGYCTAYAVISLPNPGSVALHERLGFQSVGCFPAAGYKRGSWYDVGWWRYALREPSAAAPPVPLAELRETKALEAVLHRLGPDG